MAATTVDTDALRAASSALNTYIAEVKSNIRKMKDAAVDCSDNMGSDVYSKKAIASLAKCATDLTKTIGEAEQLQSAINKRIKDIENSETLI